MLHGVQVDSYSCGINTTNTIDCAATGACVWKPKHSIWERVRWFVQLAQGGKREPGNPMKGKVSVDMQVICYILTNYKQKLYDSPITSGSESLLKSNPSLSVSVAMGDHNFPDLKEYALAQPSKSEKGCDGCGHNIPCHSGWLLAIEAFAICQRVNYHAQFVSLETNGDKYSPYYGEPSNCD